MIFLESPQAAKQWCHQQRQLGKRIGFVPTMGALHQGHLSLVSHAQQQCDVVVVSIFVNPLQFNNADDLSNYPSNLQADRDILQQAAVSMVFTGTINSFFPEFDDVKDIPAGDPGPAAAGLEGDHRPGHLHGVARIVDRLFSTSGACRAYFGAKDFQQTLVVRHVASAHRGVEVILCPTIREASGLAMSSRNVRLSPSERDLAKRISQALFAARRQWQAGERHIEKLLGLMQNTLEDPNIDIEYIAIRDPNNWLHSDLMNASSQAQSTKINLEQTTEHTTEKNRPPEAQALIAVNIGEVRLIDNLSLSAQDP